MMVISLSQQTQRDEIMYEEETSGFSAATESFLSQDCFSQIASSSFSVASHSHNHSFTENVGLSMKTLAFTSQENAMIPNIHASPLIELNLNKNTVSSNLVEEVNHHNPDQLVIPFDQSKWDTSAMNFHHQNHYHHHCNFLYNLPSSSSTSSFVNSTFGNPNTQKNFELQMMNPSGNPTLGLLESTNVSSVLLQDPFSSANREWFQSLPVRNDLMMMFGGDDDKEERSGVVSYLDSGHGREFGDSNNGFLKFSHDLATNGRSKLGGGRGVKRVRQVTIEKKRRVDFTSKFDALKELIPNPTKNDRASLICGAIECIQELRRSVHNLTLLVNQKRSCEKERIKRDKIEEEREGEGEEALGDLESSNLKPLISEESDHHQLHRPTNRCMIRSNCLQKKSEDIEVDVRIAEDNVTIKLVQRKNTDCLLYASKALDELGLDLQHVAGGHIGEFCSFLFSSKIHEGSSVCASAIANKLIEVIEASLKECH